MISCVYSCTWRELSSMMSMLRYICVLLLPVLPIVFRLCVVLHFHKNLVFHWFDCCVAGVLWGTLARCWWSWALTRAPFTKRTLKSLSWNSQLSSIGLVYKICTKANHADYPLDSITYSVKTWQFMYWVVSCEWYSVSKSINIVWLASVIAILLVVRVVCLSYGCFLLTFCNLCYSSLSFYAAFCWHSVICVW
jgi:hypothetical protein